MAIRKGTIMILTLLMSSIALLSACNKAETTSGSTPAGQTSGTATPAATKDMTPIDITIHMQDGGNKYSQIVKPDDVYFKKMSELFSAYAHQPYNVKYDMNPSATYGQQLAIRLASGDVPDVMWTRGIEDKDNANAVDDGVFLQLNDLIDKYGPNLKKKIPDWIWKNPLVSKNGKIYGIPKLGAALNINVMLYRKDWLDKLGMKPPMTLDDYVKYFEAVKTHDLNGNGKNDEIPFGARKGLSFSQSFFGYFGVYPGTWQWVDGKFIPDLINPKMKDALAFYQMMYQKGYVNQDMFTQEAADWTRDINAGIYGMWQHQSLDLVNNDGDKFADNPNAIIAALPGPVGSDGKAKLVPKAQGFGPVFTISSKSKHAADIVKLFDWAYSDDPDKVKFFNFGIEGTNYTMKDGKVDWDPNSKVNNDNGAKTFYQVMINMGQDVRLSDESVNLSKFAPQVKEAMKYADENTFDDESLYMPTLDALKTNPELGDADGSLFLDMMAKVVTGREPLDSAFDKFVADWKKHGGDKAIDEATKWYKSFYKK